MWKLGQSGNPTGKKPGTGKLDKLRAALAKELPEVLEALVRQAKAGDTAAMKLLLERTLPALRPLEPPLTVPLSVAPNAGLGEQGRAVMKGLAEGALSPGQASTMLQALAGLAKLVEFDELERRVAALEGNHDA